MSGNGRPCEWCGGELQGNQRSCCTPSHRALAYRFVHGLPTGKEGIVESPPWPGSPLFARAEEERRRRHPRSGDRAYSGLQVSYRRAVREVAEAIAAAFETTDAAATLIAARGLREALSQRQRERLEARDR